MQASLCFLGRGITTGNGRMGGWEPFLHNRSWGKWGNAELLFTCSCCRGENNESGIQMSVLLESMSFPIANSAFEKCGLWKTFSWNEKACGGVSVRQDDYLNIHPPIRGLDILIAVSFSKTDFRSFQVAPDLRTFPQLDNGCCLDSFRLFPCPAFFCSSPRHISLSFLSFSFSNLPGSRCSWQNSVMFIHLSGSPSTCFLVPNTFQAPC